VKIKQRRGNQSDDTWPIPIDLWGFQLAAEFDILIPNIYFPFQLISFFSCKLSGDSVYNIKADNKNGWFLAGLRAREG
jgi:hypothetical protein